MEHYTALIYTVARVSLQLRSPWSIQSRNWEVTRPSRQTQLLYNIYCFIIFSHSIWMKQWWGVTTLCTVLCNTHCAILGGYFTFNSVQFMTMWTSNCCWWWLWFKQSIFVNTTRWTLHINAIPSDGRSVGQMEELQGEGRGAGPRDGGHPRVGQGPAVPGGLQLAAVQVDADRVWRHVSCY